MEEGFFVLEQHQQITAHLWHFQLKKKINKEMIFSHHGVVFQADISNNIKHKFLPNSSKS